MFRSGGRFTISMQNFQTFSEPSTDDALKKIQSASQMFYDQYSEAQPVHKHSPFKMRWINGYNYKVGVINLNEEGSTTLFYAASNCGVIYNWTIQHMWLLQGHRHMITCIASDALGKWLVTADSGPENALIIWDAKDFFPQKTFFAPHGLAKLSKVAISADAKYLLTLAYPAEKMAVYWWIWSYGKEFPHAKYEMNEVTRDYITHMSFNPYRSDQFLLMSRTNIHLGISRKVVLVERGLVKETDRWELIIKSQDKVNAEYGKLMCNTFVKSTSQILVATSRGAVLVYGYHIEYQTNEKSTNIDQLRFIKMVKLNKRMIHDIKNIDGVIVTGNSIGEIHFYDDQLKLLYWVHGFTVDKAKGFSFNIKPRSSMILDPACNKPCPCWEKVVTEKDPVTGETKQKLIKKRLPSDATIAGKPFLVRDFVVCTHNQGVGFVDFVTEKYTTILDNKTSHALSMSVHPEKLLLCLGYSDGMVEIFNFLVHKLFKRLDLRSRFTVVVPPNDDSINCNFEITVPDLSVTCLQYAPSGMHLACGLNTGQLLFLDPTTIDILFPFPFSDSTSAIRHMDFSEDSATLATAVPCKRGVSPLPFYRALSKLRAATENFTEIPNNALNNLGIKPNRSDEGRTVCVYKYKCNIFQWVFIGKHRAHYKDIITTMFLPVKNLGGEYKLLSLGMDRCMVEYDIAASSDDHLEIASLDRLEQTAIPLAAIVWPTPPDINPEECRTLPTILMTNDQFKYKVVNYETTMTLATVLGPRYDYPVSKIKLITKTENSEKFQYLLFAARDVIGLQKLPLDGNPWKHTGILAHPVKILQMCFREDLGILFTIGAKDSCMTQWQASYRSVETTTKRGGGDLDPYYCLVDNGRPGWLFQEIRDLFYYIQILCQGTFSPARRRVKDTIPIDSLPDLMRALGFFPSEYEVENLIVEAKYKIYLRSPVTEIDFQEFVKLYLNHRPVFGESFKRVRAAFRNFAHLSKDGYVMKRSDFIRVLTSNGENFSRELCWYLLTILCGHSFEDRAVMNEEDFSFLPEYIKFSDFVTEIIGIHEMDNISDTYSGVESAASMHSIVSVDSDDKIL